jgi:hypothetical protein
MCSGSAMAIALKKAYACQNTVRSTFGQEIFQIFTKFFENSKKYLFLKNLKILPNCR